MPVPRHRPRLDRWLLQALQRAAEPGRARARTSAVRPRVRRTVAADPRFPGLDPGDELLDDASEVRETSEEAALRLLMETLGAEKIGETTGG
ncbi:hypothetical protein GCM10020218_063850 [Dactylosporangium vinaceum]